MKWRRDRLLPTGTTEPPPGVEMTLTPPVGSAGTYRVAIAHTEPGHPQSERAHWGPAYNAGYAEMAAHMRQTPEELDASSVDLLEEALRGAAKARDAFPASGGWECWVEALDNDGNWERVG